MRQSWSALALLVLVGALVLAAFAIRTIPPQETGPTEANTALTPLESPTVDFGNPSKGALNATVRIVEFGDLLCNACGQMSPDLDRLVADYAGSIRLVWKDFPDVAAHPGTDVAAIAARCAERQGAFWEFHDLLLVDRIAASQESLIAGAVSLGLDADAFRTCLAARETAPSIDRDFVEGQRLRVDGTPYFFINDRRVSGYVSYEQLVQIVEALGAVRVTGN